MEENKENQTRQEIKYQFVGWILFIICAIFFMASSLQHHDMLTFIGSVIFLVACIVFLVPLVRTKRKYRH
jgi:predicted membrane channel-forming protein YqfA (hemolysin III family)